MPASITTFISRFRKKKPRNDDSKPSPTEENHDPHKEAASQRTGPPLNEGIIHADEIPASLSDWTGKISPNIYQLAKDRSGVLIIQRESST
jgi:hypothetical protein